MIAFLSNPFKILVILVMLFFPLVGVGAIVWLILALTRGRPSLPPTINQCTACGGGLQGTERFCPACGTRQEQV